MLAFVPFPNWKIVHEISLSGVGMNVISALEITGMATKGVTFGIDQLIGAGPWFPRPGN
jgi:hypothetical protein